VHHERAVLPGVRLRAQRCSSQEAAASRQGRLQVQEVRLRLLLLVRPGRLQVRSLLQGETVNKLKKCPMCNNELSLGWWCNHCKDTVSKLSYRKAWDEIMSQPDYTPIVIIGIFAALAAIGFASVYFRG
jgi:hypothetical protein